MRWRRRPCLLIATSGGGEGSRRSRRTRTRSRPSEKVTKTSLLSGAKPTERHERLSRDSIDDEIERLLYELVSRTTGRIRGYPGAVSHPLTDARVDEKEPLSAG